MAKADIMEIVCTYNHSYISNDVVIHVTDNNILLYFYIHTYNMYVCIKDFIYIEYILYIQHTLYIYVFEYTYQITKTIGNLLCCDVSVYNKTGLWETHSTSLYVLCLCLFVNLFLCSCCCCCYLNPTV